MISLITEEAIGVQRARKGMNKYKHKLVIANNLQTRKYRVVFVTPSQSYEVLLSKEQAHNGLEIEEPIVADVVNYTLFIFISYL